MNDYVVAGKRLIVAMLLVVGPMALSHAQGFADPLGPAQSLQSCQRAMVDLDAEFEFLCQEHFDRSNTSRGRLKWEVLLIELRPEKVANPATADRRADVYFYNYANDKLHHLIVNTATQRVESRGSASNVQLPLTDVEIGRAIDLAFEHADVRARLAEEYRAITGFQLNSADQLEIKAFIFHADSVPERLTGATQQCGKRRCTQLSIAVNGFAFETQPIVDLSRARVAEVDFAASVP